MNKDFLLFISLLPIIIIVWILVTLWTEVITSFAYKTLKLKETTINKFYVASIVTFILIIIIFTVEINNIKTITSLL
jgi:uncharacterized membrane protein